MILPIVLSPNEILHQKALPVKRVTKDLVKLGNDMLETCKHHNALGLSANQVNQLHRILVMKRGKSYLIMYNPIVMSRGLTKRINDEECLSFPGMVCQKKRHIEVKVKYTDIYNKPKFISLEGLDAIIFAHELDHLNGKTMDLQ